MQAANAVGEQVSAGDVSVSGEEDGWTELDVDGFDEPQSVRQAAFPVPGNEARAVFQTLIVDGEKARFEVIDQNTVRYSWSKPNPHFLPTLADTSPLYIYRPAHYLKPFHKKYAKPDDLAKLVKLCPQGCEEREDLEKAIETKTVTWH